MVPIVLVHGLFGQLRDPVIVNAFDDVEVYAPDLLGYGTHIPVDTNGITLYDQAEHLLTRLDALGMSGVHLVTEARSRSRETARRPTLSGTGDGASR